MASEPPVSSAPIPFLSLLPGEVRQALVAQGFAAFRGQQLLDWVYRKGVLDFGRMTTFSVADRRRLGELFAIAPGVLVREQLSSDGTRKLLLQWGERAQAEMVMIPDGARRTACVSSQAGCPVGCRFCASGLAGMKANLSADQIVEQVLRLNDAQGRITNVVFMGMGEPLANYASVIKAIRILHDPGCLGLSARRITLSTVGVPARIRDLAKEELPINLALSLHAPSEALRRELIPWAEHFPLPAVLEAVRDYFAATGREITLEYILLSGVNDGAEQARELVKLCRSVRANVNLIRYNEVPDLEFRRPGAEAVAAFQEILRCGGVNAHVRKSRGRDIDAACGQLRRKQAGDA
jgi:23S rRNA (adenine2503-C2)-methyltransferase